MHILLPYRFEGFWFLNKYHNHRVRKVNKTNEQVKRCLAKTTRIHNGNSSLEDSYDQIKYSRENENKFETN